MSISEKELEELKKAAKSSAEKIELSGVFLSVGSKNYTDDPVAMIQFALAIFMDKPIGFIALEGVEVPKNVMKIATVVFANDNSKESVQDATKELLERMEIK